MTHRIFVPIDGSDCSRRALQYALRLAKLVGDCSIHVAHAHDEPLLYGEISVYVPREQMERLQRQNSEQVLAGVETMLRDAGVPWEKEILVGPVARVMAERAAALGCDAIVMGIHGLTTLGKLLMGSVATRVVHLSDLPVTLVK